MTSDNPPPKATNWSTVAARSARARIPRPNKQYEKPGFETSKKVDIVFEDPEISAYLRSQRALSIVQTALQPGSVIFTLPDAAFNKHTEAYKLVVKNFGPVVGNTFIPISVRSYSSRNVHDLVFSTMFVDPAHAKKAISQGMVVDGVTYKGIPYKDRTVANDYIRVYLALKVHEANVESLVEKLKTSMSLYGKVLQIKMLKKDNIFEGDVSVVLDRKQVAGVTYKALQRSLFLEAWPTFAIARFTGAEKVCFFCRKTGHIANNCPTLENITCRRCKLKGHTHRRCDTELDEDDFTDEQQPPRETTFQEDYDTYMVLSQQRQSEESPKEGTKENDKQADPNNKDMDMTDSQVLKKIMNEIDADDDDTIMGDEPTPTTRPSRTTGGKSSSIYESKHAPKDDHATNQISTVVHNTGYQNQEPKHVINVVSDDSDDMDIIPDDNHSGDRVLNDPHPNHARLGHD